MKQIALPLDWPAIEDREAFIVSSANEVAVRRIEAFGTWPVATMILTGPRKSGRSLFARLFQARAQARIIDNAERVAERDIFNAWNEAQTARRPLLVVADQLPAAWDVQLPDLRSRLGATPAVSFGDPDDDQARRLIARLLERRGIMVAPGLVDYLALRTARTHVAIIALIDALDAAALSARRALTIPLARAVLSRGASDEPALGPDDA